MKKSPFIIFRRQFTTGLIIVIPLITTIFLVTWLFRLLDGILGRYFAHYFGNYVHGIGLVSLLLLIWLVGFLGRTYLGGKLNSLKDMLIERIPLVGTLFNSIRQVSDGLLEMNSSSFEQVVMIEYPRKGLYAIGFITSRSTAGISDEDGRPASFRMVHVFVPTVPNPTSGYLLLIPENEVTPLAISVEEALKLVLSLGVIHPGEYKLKRARLSTGE
ncbi:MAG: DUF502 domain-containing protein [Candidatus Glassbacteria bacterium]|nr:DUF502 domain-containing protein [Candidatus Glassbacteria bacterium]